MNKYTLHTLIILFAFQLDAFSEKPCGDTLFHLKNMKYYDEDLQKLNTDIGKINKQIFDVGILA